MACTPAINRPVGDVCMCSGWGNKDDGTCDTTVQLVGQNLFNYWCTYDCPTAYSSQLNNINGDLGFNIDNLPIVQNELNNLFTTYALTNTITPNTLSPSYSPFQDTLLTTCLDQRLPGACTTALNSFCSGYTRDQITQNNTLNNFCGCYTTPDPVYNSLSNFNQACDPVCNRATTVQTATNGVFNSCENTVCAISDVSVNLSQSEVGSINFSNVCPACPNNASCICYISGIDVNQTLSDIGVGTQFNNLCGPNSLCNTNGVWAPCDPVPPNGGLGNFFPLLIIIGFILLTVFVILILYAIKYSGYNYVVPGIYKVNTVVGKDVPRYSYQLTN